MPRNSILKYNPKLKKRARELRKNMTDGEIKLWRHIRMKQVADVRFLRQRPIGNYIVDFFAPEKKLVIEVDGGQHCEDDAIEYDTIRSAFLESQGIKVIRFSNLDVLYNIEGVLSKIIEELK